MNNIALMKNIFFTIGLVITCFQLTLGQENNNWTVYPKKTEEKISTSKKQPNVKVTLSSAERLDELMEKDLRISEANPLISGFRIQIFYGSGPGSKTEARTIQSEYVKNYPEIPSYLVFQTPNFKIRVGDFRTRLEAEQHLRLIEEEFPNAFIVKDNINLPKIELKQY